MAMGLGLIFFGMGVMSDAMKPLRKLSAIFGPDGAHGQSNLRYSDFCVLSQDLSNPHQRQPALSLSWQAKGFITLPTGIALIFGANVGTCITALLASIGKPREAVRAGAVHILFNIIGVVIWIGLINQLAQIVTWLSPVAQGSVRGRETSG